jgi:hypothetical protein
MRYRLEMVRPGEYHWQLRSPPRSLRLRSEEELIAAVKDDRERFYPVGAI